MTIDIENVRNVETVTITGTTPRVDAKWNEKARSFDVRFMNEDVIEHFVEKVGSFTVSCGKFKSTAVKNGIVVYPEDRSAGDRSISCSIREFPDGSRSVLCGK